jgi:hypothetical protein
MLQGTRIMSRLPGTYYVKSQVQLHRYFARANYCSLQISDSLAFHESAPYTPFTYRCPSVYRHDEIPTGQTLKLSLTYTNCRYPGSCTAYSLEQRWMTRRHRDKRHGKHTQTRNVFCACLQQQGNKINEDVVGRAWSMNEKIYKYMPTYILIRNLEGKTPLERT